MKNYLSVLRNQGVVRVMASQLLARFPFGMMSLAFVIHISRTTGSYAIAGIALGAETIGVAVAGPLLGRWLGTLGARRVLIWCTIISPSATILIGLFNFGALGYALLALVVGLTSPPIQSAARNIYPRLIPKSKLSVLFGLDATLQEIIWVVGPVLATFLAAWVNSTFTLLGMAGLQIIGTVWFTLNREIKQISSEEAAGRFGSVLKNSTVVSNSIIGMLLVGSFAGVEVGTIALLPKAEAGIVVAMLSMGSIAGGLLFGGRAKTSWALAKYMAVMSLGFGLALMHPTDAIWLSACWFFAGLGIAPALGFLSTIISISLPASETSEAYGWVNTGQMVGYSVGSALAGLAIDSISRASSLLVAVVFAILTLAVSVMTVGITPALGKLDLSTKAIEIVEEQESP
jgi:MFS family permease